MSSQAQELLGQMKISTRLIAEEALRRGYNIDYVRGGKMITGLLIVDTPQGSIILKSSVGALTKGYGIFVANNKLLMGRLFKKFTIPTPDFLFYEGDETAAVRFMEHYRRVVVKPIDTDHGTGITTGITTKQLLITALNRAARVTKRGVLVQEMCEGLDYRMLVVGDKLVAAAQREPAKVVGDGLHTLQELIAITNQDPRRGKGHTQPMSLLDIGKIDRYLGSKDISLGYIPSVGEVVTLSNVANLSQGGSAIDVTGIVHPKIAGLAVQAAKIAGLGVCGVDVICSDITKDPGEAKPFIIELNESPGIRMHHFPSTGTPRDAASAILDQTIQCGAIVEPWRA